MSPTTIIWSMISGICLALMGIFMVVWLRKPNSWENFFFSLSAAGGAGMALLEMALMQAQTAAESGELMRWLQVALAVTVVGLVWFVRSYLKAGILWLAWLISGLRAVILVINFMPGRANALFLEMYEPLRVPMWGTLVSLSQGVRSSWELLGGVSSLVFLVYLYGASVQAWRRGERRRTVLLGGAISSAFILGSLQARLLALGLLHMPFSLSIPFMIIVLAMGLEMGTTLISAGFFAQELRSEKERMRLAAKVANLGLWEWDIARDDIWLTDASRSRMGSSENEKVGLERFLKVVYPDDREAVRASVQGAVEGATDELELEYRITGPDGTILWTVSRGHVERKADGTALRVRGVTVDITARKRYEAELEFIKRSIDASPDGAYWMDDAGRFVYVNDAGCGSLGYNRDEMLNMSIFDIAPLASAEGWREVWKFLRDKGEYTTETVHRRKEGSEFPVEITSTYVVIDGREYVAGFARDITERKFQANALRESMERYRAMVESFDGFIYICSAENRIEFMNQRLIERTGRNAVGEFCYQVLHDKDSVCEWCVNEQVFKGEIVRWEVQSPKDNRWYDVVNTPIRHADGTLSKQAMIQDITDRKQAESERIQLRLELAHMSRVMIMSELSSSLAHEINQPLGAILNNASTVRTLHAQCAGGGGGEVAEILDDIISDTNRAGQIVRKIRGIIKKEAVRFEPLDVNGLIREVVGLFRNPLEREKILVREELSPDLQQVTGDRVRLQQVIMNLIMNATDAMKGCSSRILTVRTVMDGPATVLVSVSDTGPGIGDKMKEKLFEPFSTTKKDGLGMGLRICRSILDDHGGSIRAENNAEGGATFSFLLRTDGGGKG